jgi:hypothetical protein
VLAAQQASTIVAYRLSAAAGAARASEFAIILLIRINRNILTFLEFLITMFGLAFERREPNRSRKVGTPQTTR